MRGLNKGPKSAGSKKRFQPAIGTDFELHQVASIEAKNRGFVARALIYLSGLAIIVAGGYGLATGNFSAIGGVWAVVGPLIGTVVGYYFGQRQDTG